MASSLLLARVFVGLLCVLFAHFLGRSLERRRKKQVGLSVMLNWLLRTLVTAMALLWWRGLDSLSFLMLCLAVVSGALGFYAEWRPKRKEEDLTHVMFPED